MLTRGSGWYSSRPDGPCIYILIYPGPRRLRLPIFAYFCLLASSHRPPPDHTKSEHLKSRYGLSLTTQTKVVITLSATSRLSLDNSLLQLIGFVA